MLTPVVLAVAVASGLPPVVVVVLAVVAWKPWLALVAAGLWIVVSRRDGSRSSPDTEAAFLRGLASELAGGSSLRAAIPLAAQRAPSLDLSRVERVAASGLPPERIGAELEAALPLNGQVVGAAVAIAAHMGAPLASTASALAVRAADVGRLARERHVSTAQARVSAWLIGGAPLALLVLLGASGRLSSAMDTVAARWIVGAGLGLETAGAAVVWSMLRRASS